MSLTPLPAGWIGPTIVGVVSFVGMEGVAWATHRYIMHGLLWSWHRSHHEPHDGLLERNDRFALAGAAIAIAAFWLHWQYGWLTLGAGCGITAYGVAYVLVHDGLVHRRLNLGVTPKRGYLGRLITAHHLHHAVPGREGRVSFGFLYAPPVAVLRR
jgi:beta-carotene 3-hydroxylase